MFRKLEPLAYEKHRQLRYHPVEGYRFAAEEQAVPLTHGELLEAAKHYPIVFPSAGEPGLPLALLGLARGVNGFVDADGRWSVPYVPAHIQRYPFILASTGRDDQFAVMVDVEAPHFQGEAGEALFSAEQAAAPVLQRVMDFLKAFQAESVRTRRLVDTLRDAGVLVSQQVSQRQGSQQRPVLTGFEVVDRAKLDALPDETFLDWRRRGILPIVYAHLASLSNIGRLQLPATTEGETRH